MSTKLLAIIPEARTVQPCMDVAKTAAISIADATVEALHVCVDPSHLAAVSEIRDMELLRERVEGTAAQRAQTTHQALAAWMAAHPLAPVVPQWKQIDAAEREAICSEAKTFDVLVVARGTNADSVEALQAALFCAGRPFFLAPTKPSKAVESGLTERIVVAWNGTAQCRRAIAGAMPWLRAAKTNVVMLIAEGEPVPPHADSDLAGVAYTTIAIGRDKEKLGDQIVTEAKRLGATLLVLGAHRHNMLIEWLTGHTTDQVLKHEELTLFLAH